MSILYIILALLLAPLFHGIVNQTKAFFAGRRGPGIFRLYFDLAKLVRKSCPRSTTSTWLFDLAPAITLAATLLAAIFFPWSLSTTILSPLSSTLSPLSSTLYPLSSTLYPLSSTLSPVLFFYLLGTGRFFTVLGALDTGSAFEGMGASREVQFSALVEPAVFIVLGFLTLLAGGAAEVRALPPDGLAGLLAGYPNGVWTHHAVSLILAGIAFFAILLSECCRVPFDDPETHLELTMIHEAMILDNAGPDLAYILYGAALKFELLAAFLVAMLLPLPSTLCPFLSFTTLIGGIAATAVLTGIVESCMARMRFLKTPQMLLGALMLAALGTLLFVMF